MLTHRTAWPHSAPWHCSDRTVCRQPPVLAERQILNLQLNHYGSSCWSCSISRIYIWRNKPYTCMCRHVQVTVCKCLHINYSGFNQTDVISARANWIWIKSNIITWLELLPFLPVYADVFESNIVHLEQVSGDFGAAAGVEICQLVGRHGDVWQWQLDLQITSCLFTSCSASPIDARFVVG